jgi:hypothetical protein
MKKIEKIIALIMGDDGSGKRLPQKDELAEKVLAILLSSTSSEYPQRVTQIMGLVTGMLNSVKTDQIARITQALFIALPPKSRQNEMFANFCEEIYNLFKWNDHRLIHGALLGSMQAVAWLYENKEWDEDEYGVAFMGFLYWSMSCCSNQSQPKFSDWQAGAFSNISTSFVSACRRGLPEFLHSISKVEWGEKNRTTESPLFHQIINEICLRALLLMPIAGKVSALNHIYNPSPAPVSAQQQ